MEGGLRRASLLPSSILELALLLGQKHKSTFYGLHAVLQALKKVQVKQLLTHNPPSLMELLDFLLAILEMRLQEVGPGGTPSPCLMLLGQDTPTPSPGSRRTAKRLVGWEPAPHEPVGPIS